MHATRHLLLAFLLFLAGFLSMAPAHATLIEQSIERLRQSPPASPDAFDFVVVADSNTLEPLEQAEVFKQIIREVNILKPNFVFEAGDIVLGGAAEGVPAQWDVFDQTIAACEPPYLALPGNHDISNEATERIWLERMGPTHYAFDYGNSLFIALNSEEVGALDRISDEQVAWLKEQLEASEATNIFVFLHKPYFAHEGDPDGAAATWERQWSNIAETFRGHSVRAVFSGHEHVYRDYGTRDGVRYVICGGASVYGMKGKEEEGKFNHYLRVRVRGEDVSWAVIKPNSILPEDVVTNVRMDELYNIRNKWIVTQEVFVPLGETSDRDVSVTVTNPHQGALKSSLAWEIPEGWAVTPEQTGYEVPPNGKKDLVFRVQASRPKFARFPVPVFRTGYGQTQHGSAVEITQDLRFVPLLSAQRTPGAIAVDGELREWTHARMAPLIYPIGFDAGDTNDLTSELGFMWDDEYLYLAVRTHDNEFHQPYAGDIVWAADNVELFLDGWSWGLSLTAAGPEVFLYWGVDVSAETVNTDVKLGVKREGAEIAYEAAFPKSHLTPLKLAAENSFRFNALMNDLDPSGPLKERHWLQLVPQSGSPGSIPPSFKVVLQP